MTEAEFKMFKQAMGEQGLTKSSVKDVRVLCSACVPSFPLCRVYFFNHSVHNLRFSAAEQPSAGTLKALSVPSARLLPALNPLPSVQVMKDGHAKALDAWGASGGMPLIK